MANNPLERAIQSAVRANGAIGESFARVGTSEHPRGFVMSAYRNAERALRQALTESNPLPAALEVTGGLKASLRSGLWSEFMDMAAFGQGEAQRQLSFYGIESRDNPMALSTQIDSAVAAVLARVEAQEAALRALILTEADEELLLGTDERSGVLRVGDILVGAAYWISKLVWAGFDYQVTETGVTVMRKQAVAALDSKTTDCCLRVHGQVQDLDKPFKLTGTPRFADEMDWPGFHWWCRTSGVLYLPEFDDGLTARMRAGARGIMREREAGGSGGRKPADAFG